MNPFNTMFSNPLFLGLMLLELLLLVVFFLFRKKESYYLSLPVPESSPTELLQKYKKFILVLMLGAVVMMAVGVLLWYLVVSGLGNRYFEAFPANVMVVNPNVLDAWYVIAAALGGASGIMAVFYLIMFAKKEQYASIIAAYNAVYAGLGIKAYSIVIFFVPLFITGAIIGTVLSFDHYHTFGQQQIVINHFLDWQGQSYSYSDVVAVKDIELVKTSEGTRKERHFIINFSDGNTWNSRQDGYETIGENEKLANKVAERSGKPLTRLAVDQ